MRTLLAAAFLTLGAPVLAAGVEMIGIHTGCSDVLLSPAHAAAVSLTAADGVALKGTDFGSGPNGVLLVHDKDRSAADWAPFADKLAAKGFHVLMIDLRGHGASQGAPLAEGDWPKMTQDVAAGVAWLRAKGAKQISLVGAGFGANLALQVAANDPGVNNLVLLSPGLNVQGVSLTGLAEKYGQRPMFAVAGSDDTYGARTAAYLDEKATGERRIEVLDKAGAGVRMMNRAPALESDMIGWLTGGTRLAGEVGGQVRTLGPSVDNAATETGGTAFGDRKPPPPPTPGTPVDLDE